MILKEVPWVANEVVKEGSGSLKGGKGRTGMSRLGSGGGMEDVRGSKANPPKAAALKCSFIWLVFIREGAPNGLRDKGGPNSFFTWRIPNKRGPKLPVEIVRSHAVAPFFATCMSTRNSFGKYQEAALNPFYLVCATSSFSLFEGKSNTKLPSAEDGMKLSGGGGGGGGGGMPFNFLFFFFFLLLWFVFPFNLGLFFILILKGWSLFKRYLLILVLTKKGHEKHGETSKLAGQLSVSAIKRILNFISLCLLLFSSTLNAILASLEFTETPKDSLFFIFNADLFCKGFPSSLKHMVHLIGILLGGDTLFPFLSSKCKTNSIKLLFGLTAL